MLELSRIVALQWGQVRVAPAVPGFGVLTGCSGSAFARLRCLGLATATRRSRLGGVPAAFDVAADLGAGRNGQRAGLDVAGQHGRGEHFDLLGRLHVAVEFAGHHHLARLDAAVEAGAFLDPQVALYVDVALELAGDADVAAAFDLALDGEV